MCKIMMELCGMCGLSVAVSAKRGLVDDAFSGYAFGAEVFPARVAQPGVFLADDGSAVFADSPRRAFA